MVLSLLSVKLSRDAIAESSLEVEYIAPQNLRTSAESFRLWYKVEQHPKSVDELAESDALKKLDLRLSGYADRLELLSDQRRSQRKLVTWLQLASAISMAFFSFGLSRGTKKLAAQVLGT